MRIRGPPVVLLTIGKGLNTSVLLIALRNDSGNGHIWLSCRQIEYVSKETSRLVMYIGDIDCLHTYRTLTICILFTHTSSYLWLT